MATPFASKSAKEDAEHEISKAEALIERLESAAKNKETEIKEIDDMANSNRNETTRRVQQHKPFFRYVGYDKSGSLRCYGGGYYLYTGWGGSTNPNAHQNENKEVNGKLPLYFRAKPAFRNSHEPNFSVQWNKVVAFYYKPIENDNEPIIVQKNGTQLRIKGLR